MTGGNGTCGDEGKRGGVPGGGEQHLILILFAPFGDDWRELRLIRRLHSLRSFHQRLFTFAPVGDGGDMQDCEVHSLPLYHHCMMRCLQRRPGGRHKFRRGAAYACANTCNFLPIFTPRANLVPSGCIFITC